jgi:hypothetical protein
MSMPCNPYVCDSAGVACLTTCASSADCIQGYDCTAGGVCESNGTTVATYGNPGEFAEGSSHLIGFLVAGKLTLPVAATLTHLAVITKAGGPNIKVALYTDEGGLPGTLVAFTPATPMVLGTMEIPVTMTNLSPGDYWVAANVDAPASIGTDFTDPSVIVAYRGVPFMSALPKTFGPPSTFEGQRFNYYIKVLQ